MFDDATVQKPRSGALQQAGLPLLLADLSTGCGTGQSYVEVDRGVSNTAVDVHLWS